MLAVFNATKLASIVASTSLLTQTETFSKLQKEELSDIFALCIILTQNAVVIDD